MSTCINSYTQVEFGDDIYDSFDEDDGRTHSSSQSADGRHYDSIDWDFEEDKYKRNVKVDRCTNFLGKKRCHNSKNIYEQICFDCKKGREPFVYSSESDEPSSQKSTASNKTIDSQKTIIDSEDDEIDDTNKRVKI
tara:strand:- start:920 stop:1327 length:408 start_codon:yes stop_codon:yes gene_type:complete